MRVTHRALALAAAGLLGVGGLGQAQDLEFKGTTQGCFVPQGDVSCSPSSTANFQDLVYHSGSFDVFSFLGSASIGSSVNNLGTFNLAVGAVHEANCHRRGGLHRDGERTGSVDRRRSQPRV